MIFLKFLCLTIGIVYGFGNIGRLTRKLAISAPQMWLMGLGIAGYVALTQLGY